jgi:hypothetical protein
MEDKNFSEDVNRFDKLINQYKSRKYILTP